MFKRGLLNIFRNIGLVLFGSYNLGFNVRCTIFVSNSKFDLIFLCLNFLTFIFLPLTILTSFLFRSLTQPPLLKIYSLKNSKLRTTSFSNPPFYFCTPSLLINVWQLNARTQTHVIIKVN